MEIFNQLLNTPEIFFGSKKKFLEDSGTSDFFEDFIGSNNADILDINTSDYNGDDHDNSPKEYPIDSKVTCNGLNQIKEDNINDSSSFLKKIVNNDHNYHLKLSHMSELSCSNREHLLYVIYNDHNYFKPELSDNDSNANYQLQINMPSSTTFNVASEINNISSSKNPDCNWKSEVNHLPKVVETLTLYSSNPDDSLEYKQVLHLNTALKNDIFSDHINTLSNSLSNNNNNINVQKHNNFHTSSSFQQSVQQIDYKKFTFPNSQSEYFASENFNSSKTVHEIINTDTHLVSGNSFPIKILKELQLSEINSKIDKSVKCQTELINSELISEYVSEEYKCDICNK